MARSGPESAPWAGLEFVLKDYRHTKIIATLGPATQSKEMLAKLIRSGVDILRLNMAHASHQWVADAIHAAPPESLDHEIPEWMVSGIIQNFFGGHRLLLLWTFEPGVYSRLFRARTPGVWASGILAHCGFNLAWWS